MKQSLFLSWWCDPRAGSDSRLVAFVAKTFPEGEPTSACCTYYLSALLTRPYTGVTLAGIPHHTV